MVEQQDRLNPAFNKAFNELVQKILQETAPKKAIDGVNSVNGSMLAALALVGMWYTRSLTRSGARLAGCH